MSNKNLDLTVCKEEAASIGKDLNDTGVDIRSFNRIINALNRDVVVLKKIRSTTTWITCICFMLSIITIMMPELWGAVVISLSIATLSSVDSSRVFKNYTYNDVIADKAFKDGNMRPSEVEPAVMEQSKLLVVGSDNFKTILTTSAIALMSYVIMVILIMAPLETLSANDTQNLNLSCLILVTPSIYLFIKQTKIYAFSTKHNERH